MRLLALVTGVIVLLVGAIGVAAPDVFLSVGRSVITPGGLYAIAALRIALGLVFLLAASASRAPRTLRVLGVLVIIAGLTTPWFGVARSLAVLDWWASVGPSFRRLEAGVAVAIGGFFLYMFRPPAQTT